MSIEVPDWDDFVALTARMDSTYVELATLNRHITALMATDNSVVASIAALTARVAVLETSTPPPPTYTDSGPIVAVSGQHIHRVLIQGAPSHAIVVPPGVRDVLIEDVKVDGCGGHGVFVDRASDVKIVNSVITPRRTKSTLDSQHAICLRDAVRVLNQGNILREFESGVHIVGGHTILVKGNYAENPRGPFPRGQHVQAYPVNKNGPFGLGVVIEDNYFVCDEPAEHHGGAGIEDGINIGSDSFYAVVRRNYLVGGKALSGCGIILEGGSDHGVVEDNVLIRTSQCGINIVASAYAIVQRNRVLDTNLDGASGNVGIGNWYHPDDTRCHDNVVRDNIVSNKLPSGGYNDIWLKSGCGTQTNNTKGDAARALLLPVEEKLPTPPIPPMPWTA